MNTVFLGHNFLFIPELESTNDYAQVLLSSQPPDGTVIRAGHQTRGRGQKGNTWVDEPGKGLTMSMILYPSTLSANRAFDLSRIAALALKKTIEEFAPGKKVEIKWPNDILLNGKKVAGILIENQVEGLFVKRSVIGVGLNVNQSSFPPEIAESATSLFLECGKEFNIDSVMEKSLEIFEPYYLLLRSGKAQSIEQDYLRNLRGYQENIEVKIGDSLQTRMMVGVDAQGRLALEIDGKLKYFDIKEVEVIF